MEFVAWDENVIDRTGDRILLEGINIDNFKKNPIIYFNHSSAYTYGDDIKSKVIGKAVKIEKKDGKLIIEIVFDEGDEEAAEIKRKCEGGFLNAVSIGFRPLVSDDTIAFLPGQKYATITQAELLEISIVEIPAHPYAVRQKAYVISQKKASKVMEEELKDLKKSVKELTEFVSNLAQKQALKDEKIKELEEKIQASSISTKSVIDALKANAGSAQKDEKAEWTFWDYSKKAPSELAEMEKTNPERYKKLLNDYLKAK